MPLSEITDRIRTAELDTSQPVGRTRLIAVSKLQPDARVLTVLQQGHRLFGENRLQEAVGKWPDWRADFPDVEVHLL